MPVTPEARRLQVVKKDIAKSDRALGKICNVSHVSIHRMLNGDQELNFSVISAICMKLGYSATWLIIGLGDKKLKGDEAKLVTEIQMLRAEIDISAKLNLRLQARITGIEREHEELKRQVEGLSNKKTG